VYRAPYNDDILQQRRSRTREFIGALRRNAPRLGLDITAEREWMAVAQHYGFPTDFLDFSYSVEAAAYFATPSHCGEIGVIYCLNYALAEELAIDHLPPLINEDLKCVPRTTPIVSNTRRMKSPGTAPEKLRPQNLWVSGGSLGLRETLLSDS
jgi:FRG domain